tara:strand:+ start:347 stop:826 length:480 start_codon:yes stop_codon:yes gene_type:complete
MIYNALTAFIVAMFMLGTSIFYVLSCVERSVLGLVFGKNKSVTSEDIRFTHASLKRLSPLLPPSNGAVIFFGNIALIAQGFLSGWNILSIGILVIYWAIMLYIILVKNIALDVKRLQETPNEAPIESVTENVRRLIVQHHLGLLANLLVVIMEFIIILS